MHADFTRIRPPGGIALRTRRVVAGIVFVSLLTTNAWAQGGPAPVVVAPVIEGDSGATQFFVATVMPLQRAVIGSAVDGRVTEFPVNEGDRVEAGQVLAQLLTDTISLELESARFELALRQAELDELLHGARDEVKEQSLARRDAAQAALEYAQKRRDRMQRLFEQGSAVSRDEFEQDRSLADAAVERLKEREAEYSEVMAGPRPETIAQSRARLGMQAAAVSRLEDQIKKHSVVTRFAGYVVAEYTEEGQWVKRGDPVAEVAALDVVEVEAFVPENYVPYVRVGSEVRVEVPALGRKDFAGKVAYVVPQADARTRTFPVKVRVANELTESGPLIKSGMLARIELPTSPSGNVFLVSTDALVMGGSRPRICLAVETPGDGKTTIQARFIEVQVVQTIDALVEVRGDCRAGDLVVVEGNERLRPGQEITIIRTKNLQPPQPAAKSAIPEGPGKP